MINIQCVYGDAQKEHVENCIIPNLTNSTLQEINFLCLNYEGNNCVKSFDAERLSVRNLEKPYAHPWGFAQNHNFIFNNYLKTDSFILMNPDCIPLPGSIDALISRKKPNSAIVEGRQWPFEHPKEYDPLTLQTPWASFAFCLVDTDFYIKANGMDELYFLYDEDVDLSWRAWLMGWEVIYEPTAQIMHFTNGYFEDPTITSNERYYGLRNFLLISKKFFGANGEANAYSMLQNAISPELFKRINDDYEANIRPYVSDEFSDQKHKNIKILGINHFAFARS